jgi:hypothetical protein
MDLVGSKGTCPHGTLADDLVARLWEGWNVTQEQFLTDASLDVFLDCGHTKEELVSLWNLSVHSSSPRHKDHVVHVAIPAAWLKPPGVLQGTGMFGSQCLFDGCHFASYAPVDLPTQCRGIKYMGLDGGLCNHQTVGACEAKDTCMTALTSDGLWDVLAVALLGEHLAGSGERSFWLKGLAAAGERCGTVASWHRSCSDVDPEQHNAALTKVISDYERLFLVDARAAGVAASTKLSCKPGIAATYKTLAALWVAYTAMLVLGIVGLMVYWRLCSGRIRARRRRRQSEAAYQQMLASVCAQRSPGAPPQQSGTTATRLGRAVRWAMPRLRAVGFVTDVGLDVYTLVMLVNSRWFVQLLGALLMPYVVMALLVGPGIMKGRSGYAGGTLITCCYSPCCWPVIWWLDFRMVASLLGVHLPCCGESKVVVSVYTELRMLLEAVFEALPSALVSTAVLYDKLGLQSSAYAIPTAVLCLSLATSFLRGASEVWGLAVLTHALGNKCFMTSIADLVWDMLPNAPPCQSEQPRAQAQSPEEPPASAWAAAVHATAPEQMSVQQHISHRNGAVLVQDGKPPEPADPNRKGIALASLWVWVWMSVVSVLSVLLFISIGCVGLLVQDGFINLRIMILPKYRFAGDARCGAGSLFGALHSGPSGSCTLPNLAPV